MSIEAGYCNREDDLDSLFGLHESAEQDKDGLVEAPEMGNIAEENCNLRTDNTSFPPGFATEDFSLQFRQNKVLVEQDVTETVKMETISNENSGNPPTLATVYPPPGFAAEDFSPEVRQQVRADCDRALAYAALCQEDRGTASKGRADLGNSRESSGSREELHNLSKEKSDVRKKIPPMGLPGFEGAVKNQDVGLHAEKTSKPHTEDDRKKVNQSKSKCLYKKNEVFGASAVQSDDSSALQSEQTEAELGVEHKQEGKQIRNEDHKNFQSEMDWAKKASFADMVKIYPEKKGKMESSAFCDKLASGSVREPPSEASTSELNARKVAKIESSCENISGVCSQAGLKQERAEKPKDEVRSKRVNSSGVQEEQSSEMHFQQTKRSYHEYFKRIRRNRQENWGVRRLKRAELGYPEVSSLFVSYKEGEVLGSKTFGWEQAGSFALYLLEGDGSCESTVGALGYQPVGQHEADDSVSQKLEKQVIFAGPKSKAKREKKVNKKLQEDQEIWNAGSSSQTVDMSEYDGIFGDEFPTAGSKYTLRGRKNVPNYSDL